MENLTVRINKQLETLSVNDSNNVCLFFAQGESATDIIDECKGDTDAILRYLYSAGTLSSSN